MPLLWRSGGSGKTTLFAELYPIWAVTGKQKKKHVVIFGKTLAQAKQYLRNIKDQLDGNPLLRNDLGPFREEDDWNSFSLVIPNYNARITAASAEQSVRGIKHGAFRPDLCILDDCEDVASVRTQETRNATYEWVTRDIFPLGDKTTRFIVIGNLLHDDSLLMRLIREIDEGKRSGAYKRYPLIAENDTVLWPGKYAGIKDVIKERLRVGNEIAWQREYLLNIVPDEDQVVRNEMIHYYDELPEIEHYRATHIGTDLAISQKETADKTAMVPILVSGYGKEFTAYVLPNIVNDRMDFPATIAKMKELYRTLAQRGHTEIDIENNQFQQAAVDQLKSDGIHDDKVKGIHVTTDKRSRLASCTDLLYAGKVLFPRYGAEELIRQLTGFGTERFDDLVDAFTTAVRQIIEGYVDDGTLPAIHWIDLGPSSRPSFTPLIDDGPMNSERLHSILSDAAERLYERNPSWNDDSGGPSGGGSSGIRFSSGGGSPRLGWSDENGGGSSHGSSGGGWDDFFEGFARGDFLKK